VHKKCELASGKEWQNGVSAGIFPTYPFQSPSVMGLGWRVQ